MRFADALISGALVLVKALLLYTYPKLAGQPGTSLGIPIDRLPASMSSDDLGDRSTDVATAARSLLIDAGSPNGI